MTIPDVKTVEISHNEPLIYGYLCKSVVKVARFQNRYSIGMGRIMRISNYLLEPASH